MKCGVGFNQVAGFLVHGDRRGGNGSLQRDRQRYRYDGAQFDILNVGRKSFGRDREVVRIEGNVWKIELAGGIGLRAAIQSADRIMNLDRGAQHDRSRRIDDGSEKAGRIANRLRAFRRGAGGE
jgi:hypothetical protein